MIHFADSNASNLNLITKIFASKFPQDDGYHSEAEFLEHRLNLVIVRALEVRLGSGKTDRPGLLMRDQRRASFQTLDQSNPSVDPHIQLESRHRMKVEAGGATGHRQSEAKICPILG